MDGPQSGRYDWTPLRRAGSRGGCPRPPFGGCRKVEVSLLVWWLVWRSPWRKMSRGHSVQFEDGGPIHRGGLVVRSGPPAFQLTATGPSEASFGQEGSVGRSSLSMNSHWAFVRQGPMRPMWLSCEESTPTVTLCSDLELVLCVLPRRHYSLGATPKWTRDPQEGLVCQPWPRVSLWRLLRSCRVLPRNCRAL